MTICVCVCVYVRYRTNLNVVGMGSKLLGVLGRTLRWSSDGQKFKKLILKNCFFLLETQKKRENRRRRETVTGAGTWEGTGNDLLVDLTTRRRNFFVLSGRF
jgi:hypothetical protein